ncbi:protein FAM151A-like isoform X2 [Lineus longissimus]|uniref:protein FAM151A-like isoform X2 n=1 Tax=Lineus longissimus TaxID=88925 RepID=UPI002B4FAD6D
MAVRFWCLFCFGIFVFVSLLVTECFRFDFCPVSRRFLNVPGSDYFDTMGDPLTFFGVSDALDIVWYHGANTRAQTRDALTGYFMMVEGDVTLRYQGLPNQTNIPIMAQPPAVDSDITFYEWLQTSLTRQDKGLKIDFKSLEAIEPTLRILSSRRYLDRPVWLNADVAIGPGGANAKQQPIDGKRFLSLVQKNFPRVTLSLSWVTDCCGETYTRAMMEEMWQLCKDSVQPITIGARASLLTQSWPEFKWLLSKSSKMTITVSTPKGAEDWENVSIFDMLHIWNDFDKRRVYFDLPGKRFEMLQKLAVTAASLLNYFPLKSRDALGITWAHAANSKAEVSKALKSDVLMLEADIIVRGRGTANETTVPIMAHPPATDSDNTFYMWLQAVLMTNKGIKLDFKDLAAVKPTLEYLKQQKHLIRQPIWLNADILKGPQGKDPMDAKMFLKYCEEYFPMATLSIGWTTGWSNSDSDQVYTQAMIDEMLELIKDVEQPVTFPVRAAMVKKSWPILKNLVEKSIAYTLSIWSSTADIVDSDDMVHVRNNIAKEKVYYDLPEPLNNAFMNKIGFKYN